MWKLFAFFIKQFIKLAKNQIIKQAFFLLLTIPICINLYAEQIKTLIVTFEQKCNDNFNVDSIQGKIYYKASEKIFIKVNYPLNQLLNYKDNNKVVEIYYPESNQAFIISSDFPFLLPLVNTFVGIIDEDYGMSNAGFSMIKAEVRKDTLVTIWKPPPKLKKTVGIFHLLYKDERIIIAKFFSPKGTLISLVRFMNYKKFHNIFFPLLIKKYSYENNSVYIEETKYSDLQVNQELPPDIINFKIPKDADIKVIKW